MGRGPSDRRGRRACRHGQLRVDVRIGRKSTGSRKGLTAMAKPKTIYSCSECGGQTLKWQGQCPHCSAWNTLVETIAEKTSTRYQALAQSSRLQKLAEIEAHEESRRPTGIGELDRVLGGGLVRG